MTVLSRVFDGSKKSVGQPNKKQTVPRRQHLLVLLAPICTLLFSQPMGARNQAPPAQGSTATPMPRVGIDANGVVTGIATRLPTSQVSTLRIRFEAGARTIWHTHPGGQIVFVEEGRARVQQRGGKIIDLDAGQMIYLPPNVAHWHGAAPDSYVVMLSLYPIGEKLERGPEVTDSEYLGK
jgi:quercetin dioxygenase-like cupin family protein